MEDIKEKNSMFNSNVYLNFDSNSGHGIKIEHINEFQKSYFRDAYYDAFMLTGKIVEESKTYEKKMRGARRTQERLYNTITFCGERGSGKTSVMNSFLGALQYVNDRQCINFIKDYEESKQNPTSLTEVLGNCEFVCLDEIDASLLEQTEEILEVVLAKMFQYFRTNLKAYNKNSVWGYERGGEYIPYGRNDIISRFEEIYRDKHDLSHRKDQRNDMGKSAVEILNNLSGSLAIRDKFQELVPMYLRAISPNEYQGIERERFLVITIDDLDMNACGYEMLEQIHRYLMVPGVIIYLAVSGKELQAVCEKHFKSIYGEQENLVVPYLEKVLPFSQRIYLPLLLNNNLSIKIKPDDLSIKETLLRKIARRMRVFYDGCGLKNHFYEEDNLRTLVNFYYFLNYMKKTGSIEGVSSDEKNRLVYIADGNIEKLKMDVVNRLAVKKLNEEQSKVFKTYYKEDIVRRGQFVVEWITENIVGGKYTADYEAYGYSYGELLRGLYILGKEQKEYKPLIHCILAFETLSMTQLYLQVFEKKDINSQSFEKWLTCMADSVGGSWTNHLLPKVLGENDTLGQVVGYRPNLENKWGFTKPLKEQFADKYELCKYWLETTDSVMLIEQMSMFITKGKEVTFVLRDNEIGRVEKDPTDEYETDYNPGVIIECQSVSCTFDIFGFVIHSMNFSKFFEEIHIELLKAIREYCRKSGIELDEKKQEELKKIIFDKSMKSEYEIWYKQYSGMVLPVYSTDIMYNVLKRVKSIKEKKYPQYIEVEETLAYIRRCYDDISERLEAEDKFYGEKGAKKCESNFCEAFTNCPFIKGMNRKDTFSTVFINFIREILGYKEVVDKDVSIEGIEG